MGKKLIREPQVLDLMGIGRTTLDEKYIKTRRLRWVRLGPKIKAMPEDEVYAVIEEEIAARDAAPEAKPAPAVKDRSRKTAKREPADFAVGNGERHDHRDDDGSKRQRDHEPT